MKLLVYVCKGILKLNIEKVKNQQNILCNETQYGVKRGKKLHPQIAKQNNSHSIICEKKIYDEK